MINKLTILLIFVVPTHAAAQYSTSQLPSARYLQSPDITGTNRERHYSMRILTLGPDFSGLIEDYVTDLYRNPAFLNTVRDGSIYGEIVQGYYSRFIPRRISSYRLGAAYTKSTLESAQLETDAFNEFVANSQSSVVGYSDDALGY